MDPCVHTGAHPWLSLSEEALPIIHLAGNSFVVSVSFPSKIG